MTKFGKFLKTNAPWLYEPLVGILRKAHKLRTPYSIYITDSLGGSFKEYMAQDSFAEKLKAFQSGLDPESLALTDVLLQRLKGYPDESKKTKIDKNAPVIGGFLPVEQQETISENQKILRDNKKQIALQGASMDESVFCYHHGLTELGKRSIQKLSQGDILDIGAYVGDSALAFLKNYSFQRVFSIELSIKSMELYRANMTANAVEEDRFTLIHAGVCAEADQPLVLLNDSGSAGFSVNRSNQGDQQISVPMKRVDDLVKEYGISPAFIKVDIEGFGLEFLKGATETIQKYKPIISLAIYHNPFEFFEAKPMLEKLNPDYRFKVVKLCSGVQNNLIHSEVILLAY